MTTAVQWLEKQYLLTNGKLVCEDFEYAEKLEKQQIIDAWKDGKGTLFSFSENKTSEQYYQETF